MRKLYGLLACMAVAACESTMPAPMPLALVASLNGTNMELGAGNVAPWHEEALCVHAADSLTAGGMFEAQRPVAVYWNEQFNAHLPSEAERAPRMADAALRFAALQPYPDERSNLYVHIAVVGRCDRAMKAALGAPAPA